MDFLARYAEGREELIQVCTDLDDPKTLEREVRALVEAAEAHPRAEKHLVTLAPEGVRGLPEDISLHGASAWLLADRFPS